MPIYGASAASALVLPAAITPMTIARTLFMSRLPFRVSAPSADAAESQVLGHLSAAPSLVSTRTSLVTVERIGEQDAPNRRSVGVVTDPPAQNCPNPSV